jgi:hypothetical protein
MMHMSYQNQTGDWLCPDPGTSGKIPEPPGERVSDDFLHFLESGLLLLGPTWTSFLLMNSRLLG